MIPDIEKLVTNHLKAEVTTRVFGETPSNQETPWVKVTQLDPRTIGSEQADYFHAFYMQLDCYAGGNGAQYQGEASLLARQARAALVAMPEETFTDAVVTAVTFGSCPRIPDTEFDPARQRYILDVYVYAHGK